jgi:hypothetical protein
MVATTTRAGLIWSLTGSSPSAKIDSNSLTELEKSVFSDTFLSSTGDRHAIYNNLATIYPDLSLSDLEYWSYFEVIRAAGSNKLILQLNAGLTDTSSNYGDVITLNNIYQLTYNSTLFQGAHD